MKMNDNQQVNHLDKSREINALPGYPSHRPVRESEVSDVRYAIDAILRQRAFIVTLACIGFVIISVALFLITPIYESTARVVIDPPGSEAFSLESVSQGLSEPDYIETQAHVLKGDGLAIDVVRQMKLDQNPVVMKKDILAKLKESLHLSQLRSIFRQKLPHTAVSDETHLTPEETTALDYFSGHLTVSPVKSSRVIEVSFKSPDPELSAQIPNALVNRYISENYAKRYDAVMKSSEWLSRQLDDIRAKAVASNEALADYQREYGIAELDDKQNTVSEREGELIRQYTQAQADRIQMESYLMRVRQGDAESVPQFRTNLVIQQITEKLVDLKGQLSQAEVSYGPNHPTVARLKSEIGELQGQLHTQEQAIIAEIQVGFATASAREHSLGQQVAATTLQLSQMSHYAILQREAQANQELYDALYARVKEAGISAASKSSNITIIDKARVLDKPTWPRLSLMLPIAFLVSWVGALAAGVARDGMDGSVRSADDLQHVGGDHSLILVPEFNTRVPTGFGVTFTGSRVRLNLPKKDTPDRLNKFMVDRPESAEAESMRSLLTILLLAQRQQQLKTILVTSPFPQEGKTTLAYNLALALAAKGNICFIDADLRKGTTSPEPGGRAIPGISNYCGESVWEHQIESSSGDHPNLFVVHSGKATQKPLQNLMSTRFQTLISDLQSRYEFLVIDSPPLLPFADARFLAVLTDGAVVVARSGVTDRRSLTTALGIIGRLSVPIVAITLNGVSERQFPYSSYYAKEHFS